MAAIDNAYQYYLSTYRGMSASRYDTHKKSQLRAVYNNIVKTNKDSPLYKIKYSGDVGKFAIDIKEKTRSIQNVIASLSDSDDGVQCTFSKKIAQSSNEDVVTAEYVGEDKANNDTAFFNIEVRQLATPQINLGNYLIPDKSHIKAGSYSFDLTTNLSSYEFQFSVTAKDTNRDVQEKLVRLINNSNVGLHASLSVNEAGQTALKIASLQTGLDEHERFLFEILPSPDANSINAMRTLGIDTVKKAATNSSFLLNGTEHSSLTNHFTVNNEFALTLKQANTQGETTLIGFKPNAEAISDNVESLVMVYNSIIQLSNTHSGTQKSDNLRRDISSVAKAYRNELESYGLKLENNGSLSLDRNLLLDAVTASDSKECFDVLNHFKDDLNKKANEVSINPMNYVDKMLVAYKNPNGRNFVAPYVTSLYSGMMLDQIC